jgi:hypothetical protein
MCRKRVQGGNLMVDRTYVTYNIPKLLRCSQMSPGDDSTVATLTTPAGKVRLTVVEQTLQGTIFTTYKGTLRGICAAQLSSACQASH